MSRRLAGEMTIAEGGNICCRNDLMAHLQYTEW